MRRSDVLVLGAGVAGLTCARRLQASGRDVLVLEGRDRVGGRIHTQQLPSGARVDLGAQWLEGENENPIARLCERAGLETQLTDEDNVVVLDGDGRAVAELELDRLTDLASDLLDATREQLGDADRSIGSAVLPALEALDLTEAEKAVVRWSLAADVETDEAEDLDAISLAGYWDPESETFDGSSRLFPGGYGVVVDHLARGLEIVTERRVTDIRWRDSPVVVTTAGGGRYAGNTVVVTFPIGVLAARTVRFEPELPRAQSDAIERIGHGVTNKVVLEFQESHWPDDVEYFGLVGSVPGAFAIWLNLLPVVGRPILSLETHGDFARRFEELDDAASTSVALEALRGALGRGVPPPVHSRVTRWGRDPFSRCSYSVLPVGCAGRELDVLGEPFSERLHFAGEATALRHAGTVHGAYLSGERVARRLSSGD